VPQEGVLGIRRGGAGVGEEESSKLPPIARRILVVDDDDPVRVMLARLLRTQGHDVQQAANARQARAAVEAGRPDLVISDIVMPGESGIELRRELAHRWPGLPVILISGYSAEGPAEFAARTANTTFVQKPFAADQLLSLVDQVLRVSGPGSGPAT
jgi:DNA-binding NtrC family response regulator